MPLTGRDKLVSLDSCLLEQEKDQKMITLSCFSRPETFATRLTEKTVPFPSNDVKRKTIDELIEIAKRKRAKESSLLF